MEWKTSAYDGIHAEQNGKHGYVWLIDGVSGHGVYRWSVVDENTLTEFTREPIEIGRGIESSQKAACDMCERTIKAHSKVAHNDETAHYRCEG